MSWSLSAHLAGCESDARSVCAFTVSGGAASPKTQILRCVAAASRDHTVRLWAAAADSSRFVLCATFRGHQGFVGKVKWALKKHAAVANFFGIGESNVQEDSALPSLSDVCLLSCGNDRTVNIWDLPLEALKGVIAAQEEGASVYEPVTIEDPIFTLTGHTDAVSSVDLCPDGTIVTSGLEQDKTARVWRGAECVAVLTGHAHAVWDVLCIPQLNSGHILASCSFDKTIRLWTPHSGDTFECTLVLQQHQGAVRSLALLPAVDGFASCGNDGMVCLWTSAGQCVSQVQASNEFLYSIACMQDAPTGAWYMLTASEDRSVRVTSIGDQTGSLAQSLPHPGTVWSVCSFSDTQSHAVLQNVAGTRDIVTACADGVVRVFTSDSNLVADSATMSLYEHALAAQTISTKGGSGASNIGDINVDSLPGREALDQPGVQDGSTKLVRVEEGTRQIVECYQWSASSTTWTKIGEVVDTAPSESSKAVADGKEYDFVFDVDLGDGVMRKLGYNNGENPYMTAQRFIDANELQQDFLEQIVSFIDQNTQGVTLGAATDTPSAPSTGASSIANPNFVHFPLSTPLLFDSVGKPEAIAAKIFEHDADESASGSVPESRRTQVMDAIGRIAAGIKTPSSFVVSVADAELVLSLCLRDEAKCFPGLDLARMLALCSLPERHVLVPRLWTTVSSAGGFFSARTVNKTLSLRFACNFLGVPDPEQRAMCRAFVLTSSAAGSVYIDSGIDCASTVLDFQAATNANARIAASSFVLAVSLIHPPSREVPDSSARCLSMTAEYFQDLCQALKQAKKSDQDVSQLIADHGEASYRLLVAVGTFVFLRPASAAFVRDLDILDNLRFVAQFDAFPSANTKLAAAASELARYLAI